MPIEVQHAGQVPPTIGFAEEKRDVIYSKYLSSLPDYSGKVIAITGCTSGTGFWTAMAASKKNAALIIMLNRISLRAEPAAEKVREVGFGHLTKVITIECDLQSFESVRAAAAALNDYCIPYGGLDALVCNAGVMGVPDSRTEDGYEVQMQTNHLSHFLLTALCMPSLERAGVGRGEARIVQHSSGARSKKMATDGVGHLKAEFFEKSAAGSLGGDAIPACFNRYHQTKLANTVFAMTLHEKLKSTKDTGMIKSLCAEPGVSTTSLAENFWTGHGDDGTTFAPMLRSITDYQSAADGAVPLMCAIFHPNSRSGEMYMPCDANGTTGMPIRCMDSGLCFKDAPDWCKTKFEHEKLTMHKASRDLLWKASEVATGVLFKTKLDTSMEK